MAAATPGAKPQEMCHPKCFYTIITSICIYLQCEGRTVYNLECNAELHYVL